MTATFILASKLPLSSAAFICQLKYVRVPCDVLQSDADYSVTLNNNTMLPVSRILPAMLTQINYNQNTVATVTKIILLNRASHCT